MTSSARPAADDKGRRRRPDRACDPGLFDDLKCRAEGIKAQADYNASHADELAKARADFEKARAAYSAARTAAEPLVKAAWHDLEQLIDQLKCQVKKEDVERLDLAYRRVAERLEECGLTSGCCSDGDCDYDDVGECDPDEVPGRIAYITRRTAEATACFGDLIKEPESTELSARVQAVQKEIEDIKKKTAETSADSIRLYAEALVARRHLKTVWRGFAHVNDYIDCLCGALKCMVQGHAAISELVRRVAVKECHQKSWEAACKRLEQYTADEVVAEYIRVCSHDEDDDYDEDRGENREDDRPAGPPAERPADQPGDRDDDRGRVTERRRSEERRRYHNEQDRYRSP